MDDLVGKLYFKDLTAGLEGFSMSFGAVRSNPASPLSSGPSSPLYLGLLIDGLDLQKAVEPTSRRSKTR